MSDKGNLLTWVILLLLCGVASFFVFYRYQDRYIFDWDQQSDTRMVEKIVLEKRPVLVGPRVASDTGFFVGPFHYYFLAPFYILTGGSPWYGLWAVWFWKILGILVIFGLVKKLWGAWFAFGVGWMMAINTEIICWNVMYVPALSVLIYLLMQKQIGQPTRRWYYGVVLAIFGVLVHFSLAATILPMSFFWILFLVSARTRIGENLKILCCALLLLLPIVIFDLRHNFVNLHSLTVVSKVVTTGQVNSYYWDNFVRSVTYFWRARLETGQLGIMLFAGGMFVLASGLFWYKKNWQRIFHFIWVLAPIVLLYGYNGQISEYYFITTIGLLLLFVGYWIGKLKYFGLALALVFFVFRFYHIQTYRRLDNLQTKLNIVNKLQKYRQDPTISVSYELPLGQDNGFEYLFNKYISGFRPDGSGHLYTVTDRYQEKMGQKIFQEGIFVVYRK